MTTMTSDMHHIPELDAKGLRHFAWVTGGIIAVLFGLILPWLFNASLPIWPWVLAGVLALWGLVAPNTLRPVYHGWMRFGLLLNKVTTPLIMGIVFALLIVPVGFVMRLVAKDPMARKLDAGAGSYRVPSRTPSRNNMEKPF
jgi:CDP-diglyceride synthetase